MVNGFEKQTHELTERELVTISPIIAEILKDKVGSSKAITGAKLIKTLNDHGLKLDPARLRKVISYLRTHNVVNYLMANSKGYYIATKKEEVVRFIESLDQRANQIILVRDAIAYQLKTDQLKLF